MRQRVKRLDMWFWGQVWQGAELLGIRLRWGLAPWVFGRMMGSKGRCVG